MIRIDLREIEPPDDGREWLETDGRGGYSSSTLANRHTRRYHGLFVANLRTPPGRYVLLSKLEDSLLAGGEEHFFSSHRYPGLLFPDQPVLEEFLLDLCPGFISRAGGITVKKSILMPRGQETLLIRYDLDRCPKGGILRLKPFLAFRGYHELAHENDSLRGQAEEIENGFRIAPYGGMPFLALRTSRPSRFTPSPLWYNRFQYTEERERGFDWEEDLFLPGVIEVPVERKCTVILSVCCVDMEMTPDRINGINGSQLQNPIKGVTPAKAGVQNSLKGMDSRFRGNDDLGLLQLAHGINGDTIRHHLPVYPPDPVSPLFPVPPKDPAAVWKTELIHRGRDRARGEKEIGRFAGEDRDHLLALLRAAQSFLIATPSGRPAVIAGYPWFGSWGRDTLISLPGLCFCTGRVQEGIEILTEIGRHERDGLLPNFFSEDGAPDAYNTVDSSLWYFWAVQQLERRCEDGGKGSGVLHEPGTAGGDAREPGTTGDDVQEPGTRRRIVSPNLPEGRGNLPPDKVLIRDRFWPVMKRIIRSFMEGTRFGIGMDPRGLLHAGNGQNALTWMDATVGGRPVTPRHGYPVEINALWYNALCFARDLAAEFGDPLPFGDDLIPLLGRSFREAFWNRTGDAAPDAGGHNEASAAGGHDAASCPLGFLSDVFRDRVPDRAVRPNQIFAVSLPFSPLDPAEQAAVVRTVREALLVPCGLRTLSPADPAYCGRYHGNPAQRDGAYHQGTVWPWLLGAFGEAALRVADDPKQEKENLRQYLRAFLRQHLVEAGVGSVSEVFDGDAPHRPGGCIAQAWSVAEILRLYMML